MTEDLRRILRGEEFYVLIAQGKNEALYVRRSGTHPKTFVHWLSEGDTAPNWAKMNHPIKLLWASEALTLVEARSLEKKIKSWDRQTKIKWIEGGWKHAD